MKQCRGSFKSNHILTSTRGQGVRQYSQSTQGQLQENRDNDRSEACESQAPIFILPHLMLFSITAFALDRSSMIVDRWGESIVRVKCILKMVLAGFEMSSLHVLRDEESLSRLSALCNSTWCNNQGFQSHPWFRWKTNLRRWWPGTRLPPSQGTGGMNCL